MPATPAQVGGVLSIDAYGTPKHTFVTALGVARARVPLGPLGIPATGKTSLGIVIPNNPWLAGKRVMLQALDLDPGPAPRPHLTNLVDLPIR